MTCMNSELLGLFDNASHGCRAPSAAAEPGRCPPWIGIAVIAAPPDE
jgi:hypothetical protein